jgi:hypothetical protein|tara:strand:- start:533 stop:688 length:156 start_codon:yes stop_codon:yes gene_type:complete
MIETLKHLIGWCGEGHGLLHTVYVFGAFIGTMFLYVYNTMRWWIRDNIWRK